MIKSILVKSTGNKSSCNSFGASKRHNTGEYEEGHKYDKN